MKSDNYTLRAARLCTRTGVYLPMNQGNSKYPWSISSESNYSLLMHMGMGRGRTMSGENEAERAAKMLARRYGDLAPVVLEDLLNAVPDENTELLSLLRRILVAIAQQASRPN